MNEQEIIDRARRAAMSVDELDQPYDALLRRRDRKRRNQRIAAGVVGIAVFVAAVWMVTSGLSLDRGEKSVAPAGEVTGPAETAPLPPLATGAPDVVRQRTCSDGAKSRLELTDVGRHPGQVRILMRFEVHRSPAGHSWRITLHAFRPGLLSPNPWIRLTGVASDSGVLVVQARRYGIFRVAAEAVDTQTGQVCTVDASMNDV